ncbi:MAG TPA: cbb3-type cytochrome oxidase assembly protein CcoS [Polyangiaceae bacterium]|nr:cbb3-type cytochrome oxidase assembly protein CcoS [Polyangiaceae bacterium]
MSVLFIAVPAALAFAISAVVAFLWASRSGQLDDLETPPLRMLHDDGSRLQAGAARPGSDARTPRRGQA